MSKKLLPAFFAAACFFANVSTASAQDALSFFVLKEHPVDQPAQMRIVANQPLKNVDIAITKCAPKVIQKHFDNMSAGEQQTFSWMQKKGKFNCSIIISADTPLEGKLSAKADYTFISSDADVSNPLAINIDLNELKELVPTTNHVIFSTPKPFSRVAVVVKAEDGSVIDSIDHLVNHETKYHQDWKPSDQKPVYLNVKVWDDDNSWASATVMSFEVPHTDIVFDTNKATVRADQEAYLQEPLDIILDKVSKFDEVAVSLYVTGYTDTVGSTSQNDRLSLNRAKAIAAWFKKHGLSIPTYYRGVGERDLAVQTPDNTPEEKNRRAVYILTNTQPVDNLGAWKKL